MNYNIFIDESGNTGNIEIKDDLTWNFQSQTHFALGAIYFKEEKQKELEEEILKCLQSHDVLLGTEKELKSKAKYLFKNELLEELLFILHSNDVGIYFDISDKKYKVIMNIVEYCIYPYYLFDLKATREKKINIATFLYNNMAMEDIKYFIDLCQKEISENDGIREIVEILLKIRELLISCKQKEYQCVDSVIDYIKNHKKYGLTLENILPIKDYNNKGTKESFLPNVDAFNSLLGHICNLRLSYGDNVFVYHDDQKQFSNVLSKWADELKKYGTGIQQLNFHDSKKDVVIQVVDFFTGNILRLYKEIISTSYMNRKNRELVKKIKPLLENCNIVASNYEQMRFFEQCNIKYRKAPLPF